jgi:hypothetical protein
VSPVLPLVRTFESNQGRRCCWHLARDRYHENPFLQGAFWGHFFGLLGFHPRTFCDSVAITTLFALVPLFAAVGETVFFMFFTAASWTIHYRTTHSLCKIMKYNEHYNLSLNRKQ